MSVIYTTSMAEKEKKAAKSKAIKKVSSQKAVQKTDKKDVVIKEETIVSNVHSPQQSRRLPSLSTLFRDTWDLFKKSWVMYLKIAGVGIGLFLIALAIGAALMIPLFLTSGGNVEQLFMRPTSVQIALLVLLALWVLALIGSIVIFEIISSIAFLLYLDEQDHNWSLRMLFERSRPYFWKYFGASLLVGIAVLGGMVFLFIPGMIIALLFSFVSMAIVLEKRNIMEALHRSYQMVKANFWGITGRVILIQLISFFISQVLDSLNDDNPAIALVIIGYTVVMGAYMLIYTYLLYKQASVVPFTKNVSIRWIWIVAVLGWICLLWLFGFALFAAVAHAPIKTV